MVSSSPLVVVVIIALCVSFVLSTPANTAAITQATYNNLYRFACFSSATYQPTCNTIQGNGIVTQRFSNGSQAQGFIAKDSVAKQIIVAFRGSQTLQDFQTDANIMPTGYGSPISGQHCYFCTAHAGFLQYWNSVRNIVVPAVQALHNANPSYAIVVTGHSLGGALAPFCALQLKASISGITAPLVYTYGQPRGGNSFFASFVDSQIGSGNLFRVTHTTDTVPQLVLQAGGLYQHHGTEHYIYQDPSNLANVVKCTGGDETSTCNDSNPISWTNSISLIGPTSPHHTYMGVAMGDTCC